MTFFLNCPLLFSKLLSFFHRGVIFLLFFHTQVAFRVLESSVALSPYHVSLQCGIHESTFRFPVRHIRPNILPLIERFAETW